MELVERENALEALARAHDAARAGEGRLVLLPGEAGIGKTSVLQRFAQDREQSRRVAWGWCDPMNAPHPLSPFHDVLHTLRGVPPLREQEVPHALLALLRDAGEIARPPVLMIVEDIHWADEASLELLRLIGRRIHLLPLLLVASYRDDEVGRTHPLRRLLGTLATVGSVSRVSLAPLSAEGVRRLAVDTTVDAEALHRRTGGNPFFVIELLGNGAVGEGLGAISDLVLERMARLSPAARALLEAAAVLGRTEVSVLRRISSNASEELEACLAAGLLRGTGSGTDFRHELVRQVVLEAVVPTRLAELHADILRALAEAGEQEPARLAHHAEGARDAAAVRMHAVAAARNAATAGSHREAAFQFARALRYINPEATEERARLLMDHARECAALDRLEEAVTGFEAAAATWCEVGHRREDAICRATSALPLVRAGRNAEADARCRQAIAMLEKEQESRELADALRIQAHLRMLDRDIGQALHFGRRAITLAKRLNDREILAAAHVAVGAALLVSDEPEGRQQLDHAIRLADEAGRDDLVAHAYLMIGSSYGEQYHLPDAERFLRKGLAFAQDHDLDQHRHYMQAWLALALTHLGRWNEAARIATQLLAENDVAPVSRIMALVALGRLRARRGEDGAEAALEEALELALPTGTLQRLAPVRLARAEAAALAGNLARARTEAEAVRDLARAHRHKWHADEVAYWQQRSGSAPAVEDWLAPPFALELRGEWRDAADAWDARRCPYEQARALAEGDETAQRKALAIFDELSARPAAAALRSRLRRAGVRSLPRGARPETRADPHGLTARQQEVMRFVAEGLTNGEIAGRLGLSVKTVDHHVSAGLAKLGVGRRREAVALMRQAERHVPRNR